MGVRACRPCRSIPAGRWPDMRGLSGNWAYPRTGSWSSVWSRPWPPGKPFLPDRWLFPEECRAAEARSPPRCRGRKRERPLSRGTWWPVYSISRSYSSVSPFRNRYLSLVWCVLSVSGCRGIICGTDVPYPRRLCVSVGSCSARAR